MSLRVCLCGGIILVGCLFGSTFGAVLTLDLTKPGASIGPLFNGLMTEEINHSYDGGLYAELIQNRTFRDDDKRPLHWSLAEEGGERANGASISLDPSQPVNAALTTCLKLESNQKTGERVGVANDGYWGIPVKPQTTYRASFYAKATGNSGPLTATIESNDGKTVYAEAEVAKITDQWQRYAVTLTTAGDAQPSAGNRFVIYTTTPGTLWLNLVSLFPPTFHDRANGNRVDLMELLAGMKPAFLRCPGGNYLEGNSVEDRFAWKNTLHDISQRAGHMGCWSYRSSDGMGLLEFMEWAEDMGSEPVLAVYAGFSLPAKANKFKGTTIQPGPDLQPYVQDALDEIEYVTGPTTSKWGGQRAADGHRAPFPLHYVEIGNEDFTGEAKKSYDGRFAQFADAFKAAYPDLELIATVPVKGRTPDVVDDHYYRTSDDMAKLAYKYDHQNRNGPKVFVGEWATRELLKVGPDGHATYGRLPWDYKGAPTPDLHAALGDAAFMTGLERNADIIVMNCYAPLLVRVDPGAFQWCPNLIGFNSLTSYASPSYYAQQMFNVNRGDTIVNARMADEPKEVFYSATRTSQSGVVFLKVVNRADEDRSIQIDLKGAAEVSPDGVSTVLASVSPADTNTIADPKKVVPVVSKINGLAGSFIRIFPANSVTVLEIHTR